MEADKELKYQKFHVEIQQMCNM